MPLPDLTHLQFVVLDTLLAEGKLSGRNLRGKLEDQGVSKTGPAFYQLMARMEDAKHVNGWYEEKIVEGQRIKERFYKITGAGEKVHDATMRFYQERNLGLKGGLAHG
jgi:hypothetical protein